MPRHRRGLRGTLEGDRVCMWVIGRGTNTGEFQGPPPGRTVEVEGVGIGTFAVGRITNVKVCFDALGLLQQLGAIPTP